MSTLSALANVMGTAVTAVPPAGPTNQGSDVLLRLVGRMTYGFTAQEWELAKSLGAQGYIAHHLNYTGIDDSEVEAVLAGGYWTLGYTPHQLWQLYCDSNFDASVILEHLIGSTTLRAVRSRRQLFERMVEFWSDHFSIYLFADLAFLLKTHDDANVTRKHALGKFKDLLRASAKSPAMLTYLNNNTNVKEHPNENYARELMELHTLGVDGGYTQRDVQEVARCFTGWTIYPIGTPLNALAYRFDASKHDAGPKTIFQGTPNELYIAPGGEIQGQKLLDALARHPSTARFISKKLLRRFWGENPPIEMVDQVAGVFTATDGDLKAVMGAVLSMNVILSTPSKYKRPFHLLVSTLRALDAKIDRWDYLAGLAYNAGHYPFLWPAPNGYPDALGYWSSLQLTRWNIGSWLIDSRVPGTVINVGKCMAGAIGTEGVMDRIEDMMLGQPLKTAERNSLRKFLGVSGPTPPLSRIQDALSLAIACPSFQWY
ncbi:MAG: DUF1800 domain-containing protein [Phycisphaerales bacterium]|nr:DUF1800 domain-containing protein [Phycisphaerales bacterium]